MRLDLIPDEAITEFRRRDGGRGVSVRFKLRTLREPDQYGNQYTILVEYGSAGSPQKTYVGKGRYAPWDSRAKQDEPAKNRWRQQPDEPRDHEYEEPF